MIPFLTIGLIDLALGLIIGKFFSTFPATQQHFMFIAFFFMIIFILMSGIFTPVESMPVWALKFNLLNPLSYLMRINRMVMLKGSNFHGGDRSDFYNFRSEKIQKNCLTQ